MGHSQQLHVTWHHRSSSSTVEDSHLPLPRCHQHLPIWPAFKIPACSPPLGLPAEEPTHRFPSLYEFSLCCIVLAFPDPKYLPSFFPPLTSCPVQHPIISEIFRSSKLRMNLSSLLTSKLMLWHVSAFYQFLSWILFVFCLS